MTIKTVIFDIGNVLIRWKPEVYYDDKIGIVQRQKMFSEVDLHSLQDRVDAGANFKDTFYQASISHLSTTKIQTKLKWLRMVSALHSESIAYLVTFFAFSPCFRFA